MKQSRHACLWRDRWVVLTRSQLLTFRDERRYVEPTEVIDLKDVAAVFLPAARHGTKHAPRLTLATAKRSFVLRASARSTAESPSLRTWSCQLRALRCVGGECSLIASLPDDILSRAFEFLPSSSSSAVSGTCRKWRDVQVELFARQHAEATARIEHLLSTDARYHLATLRRHRAAAGAHAYFTLHVEHTDELVLRADADVRRQRFVIRCPLKAPSLGGGPARPDRVAHAQPMQHVGTLVGRPTLTDVLLSRWTLYSHGRPPPSPRARAGMHAADATSRALERSELAYVSISHSMWAARCISVVIPAPISAGDGEAETLVVVENAPSVAAPCRRAVQASTPTPARPPALQRSLAARARLQQWSRGTDSSVALLHNAPPTWSADLRAFTLPFFGRVHLASKKNFQMIDRRRPDVSVMLFGKSQKDTYALDWCRPLSCVQALGIALSSFDSCLSISSTGDAAGAGSRGDHD